MPRTFSTPEQFQSSSIGAWKRVRGDADGRTRNFSPFVLSLGDLEIRLARHFGFCFGVENAVEIAYRAVADNPDRPLFLLSQMIHNPRVNGDLTNRGVRFLFETDGTPIIELKSLPSNAVIILPAFGAPVGLVEELNNLGKEVTLFDATCPFVEKVWRRAGELGRKGFAVVIHGKHYHEETRATLSHAELAAPCIVVRNMSEAECLGGFISGEVTIAEFRSRFHDRMSAKFDPSLHLDRIGVVNQTTMLAEETRDIAAYLRSCLVAKYGEENIAERFADTRDTLCYATSENQRSVEALVQEGGDLSLVVGGCNSSNTAHLAAMCAQATPTFHIQEAQDLISADSIQRCDVAKRALVTQSSWLPSARPLRVLVTAGASTPDKVVDEVIERLAELLGCSDALEAEWRRVLGDYYIQANG